MKLETLEAEADKWMEAGPFAVTHKRNLKFTADPHDYVSGRRYWWKEGGKYVRRDGQPNPEMCSGDFDRQRLEDFVRSVTTLALAYHNLGEPRFAKRATEYLEVWFVDPATCMNPNLEHAQIVPGQKTTAGIGIIDTYDFFHLLDAVDRLTAAGEITPTLRQELEGWFGSFLTWLLTSKAGKTERKRANNHGTSYDVQINRYLLFCGRRFRSRWRLWRSRTTRLEKQVDSTGRQPAEESRTQSLFYHWYNLTKLIHLCELSARVGINAIHHKGRIRAAIEYVAPYLAAPERWSQTQTKPLIFVEITEAVEVGKQIFGVGECSEFLAARPDLFGTTRAYIQRQSLGALFGAI